MARGDPPLPRYRRLPLLLQAARGPADVARVRYRTRGITAAAPRRVAGARRGHGEPPGAFTAHRPHVCTPADRVRRPLRHRAAPDASHGVRQMPLSAAATPASIGIRPGAAGWRVPAPAGSPADRRRQCARRGTRRDIRAGTGHKLHAEEAATVQVDRKRGHNPVHGVPSVSRSAAPGTAARGEDPSSERN